MFKAWIVPQDAPTSYSDVVINLPDDPLWYAAFLGAIMNLTECANWETLSGGSVAPCDAAAIFENVFKDAMQRRGC